MKISYKDIGIFYKLSKEAFLLKQNSSNKDRVAIAVLVYKNKIISKGYNNYNKTHPLQPQIKENAIITKHAEIDCIAKCKFNKHIIAKSNMIVVITGYSATSKNYAVSSKPCNGCMKILKKYKIPTIIYHQFNDNTISIVKESITNL